jgi:hypothetical protein
MSYGVPTGARRMLFRMIPLHLKSTTIHVDAEQAERLVRARAAAWLPGVPALVTGSAPDDAVLAVLQ